MSNYNSLKSTIDANIKQNGRQEITGQILNSVLNAMVNTLGAGYQFMGVATPETNPGTPDAKVFYIASTPGTYSNFDSIEIGNEVAILVYATNWSKVNTGIATNESVQNLIGALGLVERNKTQLTPQYQSGYYINWYNGKKTSSGINPMALSTPIHLNAGDLIYFYGPTLNEFVTAITLTNASGTEFTPVVRGLELNAKGYFSYLAPKDCYVLLNWYNEKNDAYFWLITNSIFSVFAQAFNYDSVVSVVNVLANGQNLNWDGVAINDNEFKAELAAMVPFAYVVPKQDIQHHEYGIIALSARTNQNLDSDTVTQFDFWVSDLTTDNIIAKYTKTDISNWDYSYNDIVIMKNRDVIIFAVIDWKRVREFKRGGKYSYPVWDEPLNQRAKLLKRRPDDLRTFNEKMLRDNELPTPVNFQSTEGYYINKNTGQKYPGSWYSITNAIELKRGEMIVVDANVENTLVSVISLTDANQTFYKPVVPSRGDYMATYTYLATYDCYVIISHCVDWTPNINIVKVPFALPLLDAGENKLVGKNMGVDGDSVTEGNQWSYYASQKLGMSQFNVGVGSACWSYKQYYALDGSTLLTPQKYTDSGFAGFGGASDLTTDINRQKWVNNNACTHIERFVAEVSAGNHPIPDVFVFAMGTNQDTGNGNSDGSVDEAMQATSISDTDFVNAQGKSLKYTMCGAMRWCIETIKRNYPNCKVFVSLPIQRASYETNKGYLFPKVQLIKDMAIQMGCQIIDQYKGCGITSAIENDASPYGPYLRDGLHPNTDGQKLMGAFAASQIKSKYFSL